MRTANKKSLFFHGTCILVAVLTWFCHWTPLVSQLNPVNVITHPYLEFIFLANSQVNFSHYPRAWHISVMRSSAIGTAKFSVRVTCVRTLQAQIQFIHCKLRCEPAWNKLTDSLADQLSGSRNQRPNTATGDGCVLISSHKHLVFLVTLSHTVSSFL